MRVQDSVQLTAVGLTDAGRVRANNEDAFVIADLTVRGTAGDERFEGRVGSRGVLLAVSDGVGGSPAGAVASRMVVLELPIRLANRSMEGDPARAFSAALQDVNATLVDAATHPARHGMAATLVAALVRADEVLIATVGDSRAYLIRAGKIARITRDQNYVEAMVRSGLFTREEALNSPFRSAILQALGQPRVDPELSRLGVCRGDLLLLCSDGLTRELNEDEILDTVRSASSLDAACTALVDAANARGGRDNITVILAKVEGRSLPEPAETDEIERSVEIIHDFPALERGLEDPDEPVSGAAPLAPVGLTHVISDKTAGRRPGRQRLVLAAIMVCALVVLLAALAASGWLRP